MALTNRSGENSSLNMRRSATAVFLCGIALCAGAAGAWELASGQASLPVTTIGSGFQTVTFQSSFSEAPLVFVMPTMEGAEPTTARVRNVSTTGFELVQVEAPAADGPHEAMTVDWVAVTPGNHALPDGTMLEAGVVSVSNIQHGTGPTDAESWYALTFSSAFSSPPAVLLSLQTVDNETAAIPEQVSAPWLVAAVRNVASSGADIALARCEAAPGSVALPEDVAYLAIEAGSTESFSDDSSATIEYETAITTDSIKGVDNGCYQTTFSNTYTSTPLLVGHMNRHDGGDGGWLRRCTINIAGVEFTIDEDTYRDTERSHTAEAAGFIVFSTPFFATFGGGPVVPTVGFESAVFTETEETITHNLTVVLSEITTVDVTVDYTTSDDSATAGSDYTATSGQLTIIAGQLSGQIPIDILEDAIFEGDEQFTIALSNPLNATEGTHFVTVGTITDDESEPQVFFSANDYVVDEAGATYPLNVTLTHASAFATSVDWSITDTTTTQGSDYTGTGGTVNIPALATTADISLSVLDDAEVEGDETAQLSLATATGLTIGAPNAATLTITDNDSPAASWAMAAGTVTLPATTDGSLFQTIAFEQAFNEVPLVFAMPGSEGTDPASIRIQNITISGFDAAQVESPNADGDHEAMTMNWTAVTPGEHTLPNGTVLEAGSVSTSAVQFGSGVTGTESWENLSFTTTFSGTPAVLGQIQTSVNETAAVPGEASTPWLVVAIRNVASTGMDVALERAEVA